MSNITLNYGESFYITPDKISLKPHKEYNYFINGALITGSRINIDLKTDIVTRRAKEKLGHQYYIGEQLIDQKEAEKIIARFKKKLYNFKVSDIFRAVKEESSSEVEKFDFNIVGTLSAQKDLFDNDDIKISIVNYINRINGSIFNDKPLVKISLENYFKNIIPNSKKFNIKPFFIKLSNVEQLFTELDEVLNPIKNFDHKKEVLSYKESEQLMSECFNRHEIKDFLIKLRFFSDSSIKNKVLSIISKYEEQQCQ